MQNKMPKKHNILGGTFHSYFNFSQSQKTNNIQFFLLRILNKLNLLKLKPIKAFTLAEVLITLSVLSVIFILVIPRAIERYEKYITANKVKTFYSIIKVAFDGAIGKYGPTKYWVYDSEIMNFERSTASYEQNKMYIEKYLSPYLKISEITNINDLKLAAQVKLNNEMVFTFSFQNDRTDALAGLILINYFVDGNPNNRSAKNLFSFMAEQSSRGLKSFELSWNNDRDKLLNNPTWGCAVGEFANRKNPLYCTKLLELNNWTFPDDYPW